MSQNKKVRCGCGMVHGLSWPAMTIALQAFIDGEGHRVVAGGELQARCLHDVVRENTPSTVRKDRVIVDDLV